MYLEWTMIFLEKYLLMCTMETYLLKLIFLFELCIESFFFFQISYYKVLQVLTIIYHCI